MADQDIARTIIFDLVQLEKLGADLERRWRANPTTRVTDVLTHIDLEDHLLYVPQLTKLLEDLVKRGEPGSRNPDDTKLDQTIDSGENLHHSLMATAIVPDSNPSGSKPTSGKSSAKVSSGSGGGSVSKDSASPERIDQFRIIRELGAGAFGVVYLAEDESLQRKVAIKVPKVSDPAKSESYINEARKAAAIDCVGIVPIYHVGTKENGVPFVVQKLIDGPSLRFLLTRYGSLPPAHAVTIMRDVAVALGAAHRLGIFHRDLKPDNVLIDGSGVPWIADFGLAISESEQAKRKGEIAGTLMYMSPEQIQGRADWLDGRSDIWSLGIMIYELLLGKPPFSGKNRQSLMEQICHREPRPLQQSSQSLSSINDVFKKCCAKSAGDRYSSVEELTADLNDLINEGLSTQPIDGSELRLEQPISQYASHDPNATRGRSSAGSAATHLSSHGSTSRGSDGSMPSSTSVQSLSGQGSIGAASVSGQSIGSILQPAPVSSKAEQRTRLLMIGVGVLCLLAIGGQQWYSRSTQQTAVAVVTPIEPVGTTTPEIDDPNKSPVPSDVIAASREGEKTGKAVTNAMKLSEANGTETLPWIVAADGSGSHRTIAEAVAKSEPGAHIHVQPGTYEEEIVFNQPLTLVGLGEKPEDCVISSIKDSPIKVAIALGTVRVTNFAVRGDGKRNKKEFNAIELTSGKLRLEKCNVRTGTWNGVKVLPGASLSASSCLFEESSFFAISAKSPISMDVNDCTFLEAGIEVVEGVASIERCTFGGNKGVLVEQSSGNATAINDCHFKNSFAFGVHAISTGMINVSEGTFENCKIAIECIDGDVIARRCVLSDCKFGVTINGGAVLVQDQTQINGGEFGCGMLGGKFQMVDSAISGVSGSGVIVEESGAVNLRNTKISKCGFRAVTMFVGTLLVEDCVFTECGDCGISLTDGFERGKITKSRFVDNIGGAILFQAGELACEDCTISGSDIGILAEGGLDKPVSLTLTRVEFGKMKRFAAQFINSVKVTVQGCTFPDLPADKLFQKIGNGEITLLD